MVNLIYVANTSLDGYTEDKDGNFDWTEPNEEYFRFITNLVRATHTHLYGRRMYETMMVWETDPKLAAESPLNRDFAEIWQAANKIVYSRTLETISTRKTQLEQTFDPEAIRQLLNEAVEPHPDRTCAQAAFCAWIRSPTSWSTRFCWPLARSQRSRA